MSLAYETINVMSPDDNEKVRRVLRVDPIERAFRKDHLTEMQYRIARCLERDWLASNASPSSGRIQRVRDIGEEFCLMPGGNGSGRAPQERGGDAADNLLQASRSVGAPVAWALTREFVAYGYIPNELRKRWRMRLETVWDTLTMCFDRVNDSEVYERAKWHVSVWAEEPKEAA